MSTRSEQIVEHLRRHLGPVQWSDLRAHAARQALFIVDPALDLMDVALALATDDRASVQIWVAKQALRRPSDAELAAWNAQDEKPFVSSVVQPFVLAQELPTDLDG